MLGWIRKDFILSEAEVQLLNGLLDLAKHQGGSGDTWDSIFAKLAGASEQLAKMRMWRTYNLLEHAAYWGQLVAVRRLVRQFKLRQEDGGQEAAKKHGKQEVLAYFSSNEYYMDCRDYSSCVAGLTHEKPQGFGT